jgi:sulfite reductase (NADPH) flavoprotein alpha-component
MLQRLCASSCWRVLLVLTGAVLLTRAVLHSPAVAGVNGRALLAAAIALAYLVFCTVVFVRYRRLRHAQEQRWAESAATPAAGMPLAAAAQVLVGFASQTGFAEQLALQTAQSLRDGGLQVRVLPLGRISEQDLAAASRALFLVSTTGEGDAPDSAAGFARRMAHGAAPARLAQLRFGILALGDRSYAQYCAFGHALEGWLRRSHAQALFDTVDVDNGEAGAIRHWQHQLSMLSGHEEADWSMPGYGRWRLAQRRLLNPGGMGGPAFHLALTPLDLPAPQWQAGDVVEIGPRHAPAAVAQWLRTWGMPQGEVVADGRTLPLAAALQDRQLPDDATTLAALRGLSAQEMWQQLAPLPHREYSIASLPQDGTLDLLVRQMARPDGGLGIGSGWLTQHAQEGAEIALRVRSNRSFHAPSADIPLILIGNGTGLAGLRAHLRARAQAGRQRNWLLFGERAQATDYLHGEEIRAWLANGLLQRLDLAFSRDQAERVYVQDKLRAAADELRRWLDDGAAIYVCGSLQGMAAGVAAVLQELLGADQLIALAEQGRYRRDVY